MKKKRINQLRSVKAKGLKKGFKNNILKNDLKDVTLYEKPLKLIQKQIKSKNLCMAMEDLEKDVIPVRSNKRESFLGLNMSFPWVYRGKNINCYYQQLEIVTTPSRKKLMNY